MPVVWVEVGEAARLEIRRATEALLAGRFGRCEHLIGRAAVADPAGVTPGLLAVAAFREQGRAAEAEIVLRELLVDHEGDEAVRAMLAAVLVDLGRDNDAGRQLELIDLGSASLAACALAAEVAAVLRLVPAAEALHDRIAPHAGELVGFHGSLARHLGLAAHVLGDWHGAAAHFADALEANRSAGAPVLVAHTCRHYSAVLRLRGGASDWDRAVALLAQAADIYRRLDLDSRADEAEAILRRSLDLSDGEPWRVPGAPDTFRLVGDAWRLSYGGRSAQASDSAGLAHLARLLATPGRGVHVIDLVGVPSDACLRDRLVGECRSRVDALDDERCADPLATALAGAEQDRLETELAALADDTRAARQRGDRARLLVGVRLRSALEQIDRALPDLGRHLRRSIRVGTFCSYEPARPAGWSLDP